MPSTFRPSSSAFVRVAAPLAGASSRALLHGFHAGLAPGAAGNSKKAGAAATKRPRENTENGADAPPAKRSAGPKKSGRGLAELLGLGRLLE